MSTRGELFSVKCVSLSRNGRLSATNRGDYRAGVDSGRSLEFLPEPDQVPESEL